MKSEKRNPQSKRLIPKYKAILYKTWIYVYILQVNLEEIKNITIYLKALLLDQEGIVDLNLIANNMI